MRLLDLFCGAGGCSVGYHRAGFTEIVGVDSKPMPRYPFTFVRADAIQYLAKHGREFDAIHASPPCQRHSTMNFATSTNNRHPELVGVTRLLLQLTRRTWAIENVSGAPVVEANSVMLCGLMFGLKVFRHRWFETSVRVPAPDHPSHAGLLVGVGGIRSPLGNGGYTSKSQKAQWKSSGERDTKQSWQTAMGIDWMIRDEMTQAIPPAYTEYVGKFLLAACGDGK